MNRGKVRGEDGKRSVKECGEEGGEEEVEEASGEGEEVNQGGKRRRASPLCPPA